jgi:hypothetical protein
MRWMASATGAAAVAQICECSEGEVLEHLDEAERRRIVEPVRDGSGRYWFTHVLIAETLRDQLGAAVRARVQLRTPEIHEQLYTLPGEGAVGAGPVVAESCLAELAHHFGEAASAGAFEKGIEYASRAADHAMSVLAFEEAARLYERALALLEPRQGSHAGSRSEILLSLATAQHRAGDRVAAKRTLERAVESATATRTEGVLEGAAGLAEQLADDG